MAEPVARRAVAYVRESTEEQGKGYSPDGQRQAIARYAELQGLSLVEEYLDFETGRDADRRPGFQRLIADARDGCFDCVLVYHSSRFARNTVEAKRYKRLLRVELGIEVVSVTQPLHGDADDPSRFLAESIFEIFDEHYSVALSKWVKMGLAEKARQGLLTGSLPWGYRKGQDGVAVPDEARAPYVRRIFELYAQGQHTDRSLAEWLSASGQLTSKGRPFSSDTVREMLVNAAYCGYVSGRRDKSKAIRGRHGPIVPEELFDHVQEIRRARATVLKPGRPSNRYLLKGLATCERCGGRMQGQACGRKHEPRYRCATRRARLGCDQPYILAAAVHEQLVAFLGDFTLEARVREEILHRLAEAPFADAGESRERRAAIEERLARLRDLYELGDLTRPEYVGKRDALRAQLVDVAPDPVPDLDAAERVLSDFALLWEREDDPESKRQLLALIFDRVWLEERRVVAVRPKGAFRAFFTEAPRKSPATAVGKERERRDSNPRPPD